MRYYKLFISILFFAFITNSLAQEGGGKPNTPATTWKGKRKQRRADRKEWKKARKDKRAEEKKIKNHHKRIQTKEVRKRMKRSKVKASRNREHKGEPFFERVFKKKGKRAKKSKERGTTPS